VRIVAVQPDTAVHGIEGWKHMASAIRPALWDEGVADEHRTIGTDAAIEMTRRLAREEGILSGPSGGGAVAAAVRVAQEHEGVIVALVADGGERYLSTPIWE
jgi:cysteine synthase B